MKKVTNLLFFLIIFLSFGTTFADELVFEYKGRYSDTKIMIDRPATNTGLHWMKKKKKEPKLVIREKKRVRKQYLCYGSLRSTADAFSGSSSSSRRTYSDCGLSSRGTYSDCGLVHVKSHTRRLKSGKTVRVKAHWRRK